jgi:uncharacterized repeat protein (TIGR01451 family)
MTPWPCWPAAPALYRAPANESPVRADPDDLLLLPGYALAGNNTVVYRAVADTTQALMAPATTPTANTASSGVADLVSSADAPYSLTIHLPAAMQTDQSYALWVVDANGRWSNGVLINDARPLWITPDEVYASATMASLPRALKVVGRNLQPAPGATTQVRLIGPAATYTLPAAVDGAPVAPIDRYVARVQLPASMPAGSYSVQVSRDGNSWVPLLQESASAPQTLSVLPDPATPARFSVGAYTFASCTPTSNHCAAMSGTCLPNANDNSDQTLCIAAAIAAAAAAGGGTVVFGPGVWNMTDPGTWSAGLAISNKDVSYDGILVPDGVSLQGAGSTQTTVVRGANWGAGIPTFTLIGHTNVSGFTFTDEHVYQGVATGNTFLQLGVPRWRAGSWYSQFDITGTSHVVITQNVFDKPFIAVGNLYAGLPIDHLLVTSNIFGAYATAVQFEGDATNAAYPYRYSDSIVAFNTFYPGSYIDVAATQGTIATQISGGYRTDFSNNLADGTSTTYLQNPQTDIKGWRAAYFWSMDGNMEMSLVSQNTATCTGDKDGDGEGISYDNNHNITGFEGVATAVVAAASNAAADSSKVTVQNVLIGTASSWVGDWMQVVQGSGLGQARKISAIGTGVDGGVPTTTFTVSPAFDVLPDAGSLVEVGELYWQTLTIGNTINDTSPPCSPSGLNPEKQSAGVINPNGQMADSATEGNIQSDTGGIVLWNAFELADPSRNVTVPESAIQSSNEIRGNLITGAFSYGPLARSGITLQFAATPDTAPPVLSFGAAISHNTISAAGGALGAVALTPSWYVGPVSAGLGTNAWKMADATLIFRNTLTSIGRSGSSTVGIGQTAAWSLPSPTIEWRTAMYGNTCNGLLPTSSLIDNGTSTVRYCPTTPTDSCECTGQPEGLDITVQGGDGAVQASVGSTVAYTIVLSNRGTQPVTGAVLSVEPSAGLGITSMTSATSGVMCDVADPTVNLCRLNTVLAGSSIDITLTATVTAAGALQPTFSVTPEARSGQFE